MLNQQNYKCKICGKDFDMNNTFCINIDHDHKTGKVRGILCKGCNIDLGRYERRKEEFEKYLKVIE